MASAAQGGGRPRPQRPEPPGSPARAEAALAEPWLTTPARSQTGQGALPRHALLQVCLALAVYARRLQVCLTLNPTLTLPGNAPCHGTPCCQSDMKDCASVAAFACAGWCAGASSPYRLLLPPQAGAIIGSCDPCSAVGLSGSGVDRPRPNASLEEEDCSGWTGSLGMSPMNWSSTSHETSSSRDTSTSHERVRFRSRPDMDSLPQELGRAVSEARWCMQVGPATDRERKRQNTLHDASVGSVGYYSASVQLVGSHFELRKRPAANSPGMINR